MPTIAYDGVFDLATGKNRLETNWKNREWSWSEFLKEISTTHRTTESVAEYAKAKPGRQGEIKDIGGFVGGYITQGRRVSGSVSHRQLLTLDIDFGNADTWDEFLMIYPVAAALYSTHKHTAATPRYRLLVPLDRPVNPVEYEAIARRVAGVLDIEIFDRTTFQIERLMYWPSTSKDGTYVFRFNDDGWLSADKIISTYRNYADSSEWSFSEKENAHIRSDIKKQGEPTEKKGIVGAFCRAYGIHDAIDKFLSDIYTPCDQDNRYTFKGGSTNAGLIVYDDKFTYSHHGTDPTSLQTCNAFDLVRLHLYSELDVNEDRKTLTSKKPSYAAMSDFAREDETVRKQMGRDRIEQAKNDFDFEDVAPHEDGPQQTDDEWLGKLELDEKNKYASTINNVIVILNNDPNLKGKFGFNQFEQRETISGNLPWRKFSEGKDITDVDDAGLRHYVERVYGISNMAKVKDAFDLVVKANGYHPVRDYLNGLQWDGHKRIDKMFVRYMGAEDIPYTWAVTRKMMTAAVSRIFRPGVKFEYVLTLVGPQGKGKSEMFAKLFGLWFSDSFSGVHGKESFEQLQGVWGVEIAELSGLKKADVDSVKHYIGKKVDRYRVAYGKRSENFPRQCIFLGTTNELLFLMGINGDRRFWPVQILQNDPMASVFDDLDENEVGQLWAEAMLLYVEGEELFLDREMEEEAFKVQTEHTREDDRAGLIEKYLDTLLPTDWDERDIYGRREFLNSEDPLQPKGTIERQVVCVAEIWCECLGGQQKEMGSHNTKELHSIIKRLKGWSGIQKTIRHKIYGFQRGYHRTQNISCNK